MKEIKYEEAVHKLETIVDKMERGELDIDSMAAQLKEAQELVKLCKQKLKRTDNEIQKLLEKQ
ncbi:exodeoxyribonuclease VII small subunit [Prevotella melaninogenica]|jgi:exonuclease VII small subunit|uniref:exodeoxyribonuclease VII small subunit n=1 Tax=Prevotella sp. TaxID=59823 RepID=UPI001CB54F89|nr:exodeoxyribonuclease VII small subunit [Prevotella sp.]MBF1604716.1 exodeoxyribonuclease VII small subunit [Prevotella sp.]MBF1613415.1 exodeoxyribonuclease VII small subunit [Prevotella sp.]MBF1624865.1 exodeoxyribonuclease VII small subunit [Prevotella sp.]MBF1635480.1 exodeoxyribonuclease VII small subunit [Prevotella sp.]